MARAHPGETPGQLSLDDWTETLEASPALAKAEPHSAPTPTVPRGRQSA
jgi:hypothetical protein